MITAAVAHRLFKYDPQSGIIWRRVSRGNSAWGTPVGSKDAHGYLTVTISYKAYAVHRLAWLLMMGAWPSHQVDHINGDRADNRWSNLRRASNQENSRNRVSSGVSTRLGRASFRARLKVGGVEVLNRSFKTEEEARELVDLARTVAFEEYRRV